MATITAVTSKFEGIYIVPEAALYLTATLKRDVPATDQILCINSRNLIRWIRVGLMSPEIKNVSGRELVITFEDLISMRVIAILRSLNVSWHKIHLAEQWLREKTGYPRPFAIEKVWTETEDIFANFHEGFIAASRHGQLAFPAILGQYLQSVQDMIFVPHNSVRVADSWRPHDDILMNPKIQFGEPCIEGTRLRTRVLWQMWKGGDTIPYIVRAFDLTEQQINHALEWEDRLNSAKNN
jgi:uncharacterized protein (DUF433 family)